jgi:hypothetical protein
VIGVFGFSLFGSLSLFPSTIDRIKDFTIVPKSFVMFGFGVIWVLASVGVMSGLHGKSDFEQTFCRVTGRLSMLGLAVLVALHVWWTFPSDNISCIVGFSCLVFLAVALHLASFVWVSNSTSLQCQTSKCLLLFRIIEPAYVSVRM